METLYQTNYDNDFFGAFPDLYHTKGYPYKSQNSVNPTNNRKRAAEDYLTDEGFQIPRFNDDRFSDLSNFSLTRGNNTVNNLQSVPVSQPHHHQRSPSDIGELHLSASQQTPSFGHQVNRSANNNNSLVFPKFPPQTFYLPDISARNSLMSQTGDSMPYSAASSRPNVFSIFDQEGQNMSSPTHPFSTISQSQLSNQLGFQMQFKETSPALSSSPIHSTSTASPRRDSTSDSDENVPLSQLAQMRRAAAPVAVAEPKPPLLEPMVLRVSTAKKTRAPRKKKKKDPNEPQKPVSAYALFFRDTQSAIKGQNPSATFGEVSKIVASMWEGLDDEHKSVYKKKTESAKKEYLKQIAAYRASQVVSQAVVEEPPVINSTPVISKVEKLPSPQQNYNENVASPPHPAQPGNFVENNGPVVNQQMSPPLENNGYVMEAPHLIPQQPQTMEQSPPHGFMNQTNYQPIAPRLSPEVEMTSQPVLGPGRCVRNGCTNQSVESPAWDSEYCSNACVVSHCRDVFTAWVASRQTQNAFA